MRRKNTTSEMMKSYITESLLLLLQTMPYSEINICQITKKAGVNRSTYYRHFSSKESIIKHYYESLLLSFRQHSLAFSTSEDIKTYLQRMFTYFLQCKKQLLLLHQQELSHLLLDSLNETFTELTLNSSFDTLFSVYYHTGGIFNSFKLWFDFDMQETPERMAAMSVKLLPDDFSPMLMKKAYNKDL